MPKSRSKRAAHVAAPLTVRRSSRAQAGRRQRTDEGVTATPRSTGNSNSIAPVESQASADSIFQLPQQAPAVPVFQPPQQSTCPVPMPATQTSSTDSTSSSGNLTAPKIGPSNDILAQANQPQMVNSHRTPLSRHVDNSIKHKIVNGEYVNLASLLVRHPGNDQVTSVLSLDQNGQIISQPKQPNKISTIERWTDAFLIFTSIYAAAHPSRTQELLKYMHDVRLGQRNP